MFTVSSSYSKPQEICLHFFTKASERRYHDFQVLFIDYFKEKYLGLKVQEKVWRDYYLPCYDLLLRCIPQKPWNEGTLVTEDGTLILQESLPLTMELVLI